MLNLYHHKAIYFVSLIALLITGCSDNSSNRSSPPVFVPPVFQSYEIQVVNMTLGQPLSPFTVIAHNSDYDLFVLGEPVSEGFEVLAEGGNTADLEAEAQADDNVVVTLAATDVLAPGDTLTMNLSIREVDVPSALMSGVSMLVNTNDAIVAFQDMAIDQLDVGESIQLTLDSLDAGTEANSEMAGTIPGPADGGEGFNPARDDLQDAILSHPGVITVVDGLSSSVLGEEHRWDNPVASVTITRLE